MSVSKGRIWVGHHILHHRDPRALCGPTVTCVKGTFRLEEWRKAARRPEEWQGDLPCGGGSEFRGGEEGGWFRKVGEAYSAQLLCLRIKCGSREASTSLVATVMGI